MPEGTIPNTTLSLTIIWNTIISDKGWILSMISMGFTAIMVMFMRINREMKHSQETKDQLKSYTRFGYYSDYLKGLDKTELN